MRYTLCCTQCHATCAGDAAQRELPELLKYVTPTVSQAVKQVKEGPLGDLFFLGAYLETWQEPDINPNCLAQFLWSHAGHRLRVCDEYGYRYDDDGGAG